MQPPPPATLFFCTSTFIEKANPERRGNNRPRLSRAFPSLHSSRYSFSAFSARPEARGGFTFTPAKPEARGRASRVSRDTAYPEQHQHPRAEPRALTLSLPALQPFGPFGYSDRMLMEPPSSIAMAAMVLCTSLLVFVVSFAIVMAVMLKII